MLLNVTLRRVPEFCLFISLSLARADGMDDVPRPKVATAGDHRAANRTATDFIALLLDGRTAFGANGARHASAQNQRGIGHIDDGIGVEFDDITFGGFEGFTVGMYIRRVGN